MTWNKETAAARSAIIQEIRAFFLQQDFLEVDTPILHQAPIPEAFIELFAAGPYLLQASPEYLMKRLVARGIGPIFQLARCSVKTKSVAITCRNFCCWNGTDRVHILTS